MKFKHTAILLALVLALIVGLIAYSYMQNEDEVSSYEALFPGLAGLNATDIDTLEFVRTQPKDEKLVFTRVDPDKKWRVTSPTTAAVEQRDVDSLVEAILKLKPVQFAELKSDPKVHGLDAPTVKLTVRQGSTKTATLNVGHTTIGGDKAVTFVTTSANPSRPLAVKKLDLAPLFKDPSKADGEAWATVKSLTDFRQRRLLGTDLRDPLSEATALRVKTGGKDLNLKAVSGGNWQFVSPETFGDADAGGDSEINPQVFTGVRPLLNTVTLLQAQSPADVIESPSKDDLIKYGFKPDDPATTRIELTSKAGTEVLYVGKEVEGDAKPAKRYVRLDGDSCVVKVPFDKFDSLLRTVADPSEMRNRDLMVGTSYDRIDAIEITVGSTTNKLRKLGPKDQAKWYLVSGMSEPREANFTAVDQLLQTLTRPRVAVGFPAKPDPAAYAGAELKATVSVWLDSLGTTALPEVGKSIPEPPTKGEPIVLVMGKKEGDAILLKRTEKSRSTEYKVPELLLVLAAKSRLDFLSAGVPTFLTNKVAKATLDRPTGPVEVLRVTGMADPLYPNGKWTFARPAERKDKIADQPKLDALLGVIATMRASKVVGENSGEAELKAWGFAPVPRLKVSIELSDEPGKIRGYEFGFETADKGFVYARHSGADRVYLVPKVDVDRLLNDDFRDSILYRIDRAKLNGFSIRGWSGIIPVPPTHEYVRTGPDWKCTVPPGVEADPVKVGALLGHIEQPRALRFLGPILPEHKLDAANGAIEITLKQDGLPPITLTLGAETDGGLNYIATSSTTPGEAIVIPAAAIRVFASKPDALSKPKAPNPVALPVVPEKK